MDKQLVQLHRYYNNHALPVIATLALRLFSHSILCYQTDFTTIISIHNVCVCVCVSFSINPYSLNIGPVCCRIALRKANTVQHSASLITELNAFLFFIMKLYKQASLIALQTMSMFFYVPSLAFCFPGTCHSECACFLNPTYNVGCMIMAKALQKNSAFWSFFTSMLHRVY